MENTQTPYKARQFALGIYRVLKLFLMGFLYYNPTVVPTKNESDDFVYNC